MSVITKVAAVPPITIVYQSNEGSTLQLLNGISNDIQKLLKYFNGTAIFTPFFLPSAPILPIILALHLNEGGLSLGKTVLISSTFNSSL